MKLIRQSRSPGGALILALTFCACGSAVVGTGGTPSSLTPEEIEALYRARQDSSQVRYTDADVAFMHQMIGHHAQALEMSALVPSRNADAQIRILAARIINAQQDEIGTMEQWLRDRGQALPDAHGGSHAGHMPGMLSEAQFSQLEQARGREFDRLFLELMIQHHNGAVQMVEALFATDGAAQDEQVFKFASDALADQGSEVDRMETMLEALR